MPIERTLAIVKPDGVKSGWTEEIKQRYLDAGLRIVTDLRMHLDEPDAEGFYTEHKGRFYFVSLVLAMTSGPCHVMVLEGNNAVKVVRDLNGSTDPSKAAPGTIRHDFRSGGGPFNTVHGSDSVESYERELKVLRTVSNV